MGNTTTQFQELFQSFCDKENPVAVNTLITDEINNLTYAQFTTLVGELNTLSKRSLDSNGQQLVFAVKKDTDSTVFWKARIQIACVKVDPNTQKVQSYRLLNLGQFLKVFKTLKCQTSAAEQSKHSAAMVTVSTLLNDFDSKLDSLDNSTECCICLERQQEVILPCAHSYCSACVDEWIENNDTCPICREKIDNSDDMWLLSEVPNADEICKEIRDSLMELSNDKPGSS